jgi:uncharacterized membrane protein YfcA
MSWGTLDPIGWVIGIVVGLFTGVVSGLMGIGGGNIMVPSSTILLHLGQHQAQGVSLLVIVPTAIVGTWSHYRRGNVNVRVAIFVSLGAVAGGLFGARVAQGIPSDPLRVIFGIILLYFAMRYLGVEAWLRARLFPSAPRQVRAATAPPPPPAPPSGTA